MLVSEEHHRVATLVEDPVMSHPAIDQHARRVAECNQGEEDQQTSEFHGVIYVFKNTNK